MIQVMEDVKLIINNAKRTGMSKDELTWELAKYKNTACYMYGVEKSEYVAYVNTALTTF